MSLMSLMFVGVGAASGQVAAIDVNSEAGLRAAFDDVAETEITLTGDVVLSDCGVGALVRPVGAVALVINGGGFTLSQTCTGERVITNEGGSLELRDLTVTGGSLDVGAGEAFGGGVYSVGAMTLVDAVVAGNRADGSLGGVGGGVATEGPLRIESSVVTGNVAGGGESVFNGRGGGVYSNGPTEVVDSLISGNVAAGAVAQGGAGGGLFINERLELRRSTVSGNTAEAGTSEGSGDFGGAVANGAMLVVNSTVHANTAAGPGSGNGGVNAAGLLTLVYSAVTQNSAATGSANVVFKPRDRSAGSVVAEPLGGAASCSGPVGVSGGFNFGGDASCGFVAGSDVEGAGDPGLGALSGGDGGLPVRRPMESGPLVDAIESGLCFAGDAAGVTTDQLGVARPQGDGCDIGPVEFVAAPPPSTDPTVPPTEPTAPPTEPTDPSTTVVATAPPTTVVSTSPTSPTVPSTVPPTTGDPEVPSGGLPGTGTTVGVVLLIAAGLVGVGLLVRRRASAGQRAD
ncbi:MAG: choice-of-anchor Q domain-containing protein [Actinomycetota bacterium]